MQHTAAALQYLNPHIVIENELENTNQSLRITRTLLQRIEALPIDVIDSMNETLEDRKRMDHHEDLGSSAYDPCLSAINLPRNACSAPLFPNLPHSARSWIRDRTRQGLAPRCLAAEVDRELVRGRECNPYRQIFFSTTEQASPGSGRPPPLHRRAAARRVGSNGPKSRGHTL